MTRLRGSATLATPSPPTGLNRRVFGVRPSQRFTFSFNRINGVIRRLPAACNRFTFISDPCRELRATVSELAGLHGAVPRSPQGAGGGAVLSVTSRGLVTRQIGDAFAGLRNAWPHRRPLPVSTAGCRRAPFTTFYIQSDRITVSSTGRQLR